MRAVTINCEFSLPCLIIWQKSILQFGKDRFFFLDVCLYCLKDVLCLKHGTVPHSLKPGREGKNIMIKVFLPESLKIIIVPYCIVQSSVNWVIPGVVQIHLWPLHSHRALGGNVVGQTQCCRLSRFLVLIHIATVIEQQESNSHNDDEISHLTIPNFSASSAVNFLAV